MNARQRKALAMSSATHRWCQGDSIEILTSEAERSWQAVVARNHGDTLQLRLLEVPPRVKPLEAGAPLRIRRVTADGLMLVRAELAQPFEGHGTFLRVRPIELPEVLQRRSLFRLPTALPLTLQVVRARRADWESKRVYHHLTADASGSGCSIETEIPLEPMDRLRVTLWPDRPHAVVAGARVVWSGPSDWPGLSRVGLSFTAISTHGQDRIVGTLLEEDRIRRRLLSDH